MIDFIEIRKDFLYHPQCPARRIKVASKFEEIGLYLGRTIKEKRDDNISKRRMYSSKSKQEQITEKARNRPIENVSKYGNTSKKY